MYNVSGSCLRKFVGKAAVYRNGTIFVVLFNELGFVCLFLFSFTSFDL